ncbi:hypothetical protein D3C84_1131940 [compost metagenome]
MFLHVADHSQASRGTQRVGTESVAEQLYPLAQHVHDGVANDHTAHWRVAGAHTLPGCNDVRNNPIVLAPEPLARTPHTRDHFVGDEQDTVPIANFT